MTCHKPAILESVSIARVALLATLVCVTGCEGCRKDGDQLTREELEKRAKEQRESLEMSELLALPLDADSKVLTAKPGHWYETRQEFKSNREDLQVVAVGSVIRGNERTKLPGTNILNEFTRRTSLPKGQTKTVELQYFVPFSSKPPADGFNTPSNQLKFRTELFAWPLMTPILQAPNTKPANEIKPHEFQLIVLSPQALNYAYLSVLDAVSWRGDELMMAEERTRSYHVALLKPENNQYPVPRSLLTLTATAVMVWDDVSVDDLSTDQQNAIVDWVHWGGQLIVSGPSSWSRLKNSFLSPYLPASSAEATELGTSEFDEISDTWMVDDIGAPGELDRLTVGEKPIGALRFSLSGDGSWLPGSGELVAERQIGRGRIVLTSFPLREPRIYQWKYFSSLFSSGLLRRPARIVERQRVERYLEQVWAVPFKTRENDARLHSNVRILSRDLPLSRSNISLIGEENLEKIGAGTASKLAAKEMNLPPSGVGNEASHWAGGTSSGGAAWNDYSGLSYEALRALRSAAGIDLPSKKTILYLLASYLLCLVPLNWIVFRMMGRLEFAWIAAPVLAIAGVIIVTKVARLDIGFARRTSEISVLELQGDHNRGHLSQYVALYTSLSTNYAVDFPEYGAVALPLGDVTRVQRRAGTQSRTLRTNYGRSEGVTLEPLTVYSNSTEMIHSEQMIGLPGGLRLGARESGEDAIKNDTGLPLKSTLIVRRTDSGAVETAWVGDLSVGQTTTLQFGPVTGDNFGNEWAQDPVTQASKPEMGEGGTEEMTDLWIGGVMHEIVLKTPLVPGQTRLVGYTEESPGNLSVTPSEDQFDGRCVVVAHLKPGRLGPLTPDKNILSKRKTALVSPASQGSDSP